MHGLKEGEPKLHKIVPEMRYLEQHEEIATDRLLLYREVPL